MFDPIDEDRITCEHCGLRYYQEVGMGHMCKEGVAAAKKATDEFNARYEGSGKKIKVNIEIEIECYDSSEAVELAINDMEMNSFQQLNKNDFIKNSDKLMGFNYSMRRTISKK